MKKINMYFFQQEIISITDALWFYGGITTMILVGSVVFWT
nr:MAG TPA: protein of unknown function (DUF3961) [Caudoviricetes sp.]